MADSNKVGTDYAKMNPIRVTAPNFNIKVAEGVTPPRVPVAVGRDITLPKRGKRPARVVKEATPAQYAWLAANGVDYPYIEDAPVVEAVAKTDSGLTAAQQKKAEAAAKKLAEKEAADIAKKA